MSYVANQPGLWHAQLPWPQRNDHKYRRGHVLVKAGVQMTGAARLAAQAAARVGAGAVTVAAPSAVWPIYETVLTSVMVAPCDTVDSWQDKLDSARYQAVVIGPGAGPGAATRDAVLQALSRGLPAVIDADGLTAFEDQPHTLFDALHEACVLTPHAGEFRRLFGLDPRRGRVESAREAARLTGAQVVLKGADTIIAHPDGSIVINHHAPADLATAGSGDVLSGLIAGLLAQGMATHAAACAAVWIHASAARQLGRGLLAEDLPTMIPTIWRELDAMPRHFTTTPHDNVAADERLMALALTYAQQAYAMNEVPVGALVVDAWGNILGVGFNQTVQSQDPTAHAEIMALRHASSNRKNYRLEDCTLVVTLEPCVMCVGAALQARLKRVVYGASDPKTGACHSVIQIPANQQLNHQTQLNGGVLAQRCQALLQAFFAERR